MPSHAAPFRRQQIRQTLPSDTENRNCTGASGRRKTDGQTIGRVTAGSYQPALGGGWRVGLGRDADRLLCRTVPV
jgi:hypothetical protein